MYAALLRAVTGVFLLIAVAAAFHADEIRASEHPSAVGLQAIMAEAHTADELVELVAHEEVVDEAPAAMAPADERAVAVDGAAVVVPVVTSFRTVAGSVVDKLGITPNDEKGRTFYRVHRITAYCDRGLTAAGVPAGVGQCAAPADVPFGSEIYIPALNKRFVVTDRTHKRFRNNTVDLFMPSCRDCREFGVKYLECEITPPAEPLKYGSRAMHRRVAQFR